jgi:predicted ATPase
VTVNKVHIKNFKSIVDLSLDLGAINVFIGENGSGKSNILEAFAFMAAAAAGKLDNEFLASRGIRVADPQFMRSAFVEGQDEPISIGIEHDDQIQTNFEIKTLSDSPYPRWRSEQRTVSPEFPAHLSPQESLDIYLQKGQKFIRDGESARDAEVFEQFLDKLLNVENPVLRSKLAELFISGFHAGYVYALLEGFVIYSPENSALRTFEKEGQILPLGVRGEGLLKLLRVLAKDETDSWEALLQNMSLLDWLASIEIDQDNSTPEQSVRLRDRFVSDAVHSFDQRSANEGFLYLLFFFALVLSKSTPQCFAIENMDTALNPKLCSELMRRLATLAIERKKQVLFTTHNPSLLDGLDLHDDNQRLFVVSRNRDGHTTARRILPPRPVSDELPIRLSEAFTRGLLGGIPQNF